MRMTNQRRHRVVLVALVALLAAGPAAVTAMPFLRSVLGPLERFAPAANAARPDLPRRLPAKSKRGAADTCVDRPLVIVPSLIGNQIDAKLANKPPAKWWCQRNSDWFRLWLPAKTEMLPEVRECWFSDLELRHPEAGNYTPPEGVSIRFPASAGNLDSVNTLMPNVTVWGFLNDYLEKNMSYTPGRDLSAVPYDWRAGPDSYGTTVFADLRAEVEAMSGRCGGKKVTLISLSMGGPVASVFLAEQSTAWKDKYVEQFISLSGVFAGSSWATFFLGTRTSEDPYPFPAADLHRTLDTWGSIPWLMPDAEVFKTHPFVLTPERNFTAQNFDELLKVAAWSTKVVGIYNDVKNFTATRAPGVSTLCISGTDVPTLDQLIFATEDLTGVAKNTTVSGDGTVIRESLDVCAGWKGKNAGHAVLSYEIPGMLHAGVMSNVEALTIVIKALSYH
jgi:pimeloyl-ACP methyl ester carboxylesterase